MYLCTTIYLCHHEWSNCTFKTQKACKQGWVANIGPKFTSIYPTYDKLLIKTLQSLSGILHLVNNKHPPECEYENGRLTTRICTCVQQYIYVIMNDLIVLSNAFFLLSLVVYICKTIALPG